MINVVDFNKIQEYLDELFVTDEKASKILESVNFTPAQLKIVNTLIIRALIAYDDSKSIEK
jgi:hypothetical protein